MNVFMMRYAFLLGLLSSLTAVAVAQPIPERYPLQTTQAELTFTVRIQPAAPFFTVTDPQWDNAAAPALQWSQIAFHGADLRAEVTLPAAPASAFVYRISGVFVPAGGAASPSRVPEPGVNYRGQTAELIWPDVAEYGVFPDREYRIQLRLTLFGPVNCAAPRPRYTLAQNWPLWAGVGIGAVAVGWGQWEGERSQDRYATYRQRWEASEAPSEATEALRTEADQYADREKLYTTIGAVTAGVSAAVLLIRHLKMRRQRRYYDTYCTAEPARLSLFIPPPAAGAGVGLRYQF
jgi:hypothetical protein